jgi:phage tail-like protein
VSSVWFGLEFETGGLAGAFFDLTLSTAVEPIEGQPPLQARPLPQRVTLVRQHGDDIGIFAWYQSVRDNGPAAAQRNCRITVFNESGQDIGRYQIEMAWPFKYELGLRQRDGEEQLVETVTLACERVRRVAD